MVPRLAVGGWSALVALLCVFVAFRLPWRPGGAFTVVMCGLAAAHLVTAGLCAAGSARRRAAWLVQSALAVLALAFFTFQVVASAVMLARLYGGVGAGVGAATTVFLAAIALPVLPLAVWGLVVTARRRVVGATALLLVVAATAWTWRASEALAGEPLPAALAELPRVVRGGPLVPPAAPVACAAPPGPGALTAFVTSSAGLECVQADSPAGLRARVADRLAALAGPVAVDEVTGAAPLGGLPLGAFDGLTVRPVVDGVCAGARCLAPWQLVAADAFAAARPFDRVPDLKFGVSRAALAEQLGAPPDRRIATRPLPLETGEILAAAAAAERYILGAQEADGRFTYAVDRFTAARSMRGYGVPRQAGTTLALCELGADIPAVADAARRALEPIARDTARYKAGLRRLGPSALALAALARCRPRVGNAFDGDIAILAGELVAAQRADGGFHHRYDTASGAPLPGPDDFYASGQAILALILVAREGVPGAPPRAALDAAVWRAMDFTARDGWPDFLRDFFFLEENWHCLAARAALAGRRHDGYERFCLDHVGSRARFILGDDVAPAWRGGMGFGNVVPPHNTPTSGQGEILAAAVELRRARGEDASGELADLRRVLGYLVRHQVRAESCVPCADPARVAGGFTEGAPAPAIRIDYVQHAWSALAHGARMIGG